MARKDLFNQNVFKKDQKSLHNLIILASHVPVCFMLFLALPQSAQSEAPPISRFPRLLRHMNERLAFDRREALSNVRYGL